MSDHGMTYNLPLTSGSSPGASDRCNFRGARQRRSSGSSGCPRWEDHIINVLIFRREKDFAGSASASSWKKLKKTKLKKFQPGFSRRAGAVLWLLCNGTGAIHLWRTEKGGRGSGCENRPRRLPHPGGGISFSLQESTMRSPNASSPAPIQSPIPNPTVSPRNARIAEPESSGPQFGHFVEKRLGWVLGIVSHQPNMKILTAPRIVDMVKEVLEFFEVEIQPSDVCGRCVHCNSCEWISADRLV